MDEIPMDHNADFKNALKDFDALYDSYWPYVIASIIAILTTLRSYMSGPSCPSDERIEEKNVIITGASSGIGRETALELARRGGHIILAVKNIEAGEKVAEEIRKLPYEKVEVKKLDLSSLESVCDFAKSLNLEKVDILINNAGIVFHPFEKTREGFEMHFITNYLGHYLLTLLLLPKLKKANQGRIINISAKAHADSNIYLDDLNLEKNYSKKKSFGQSKLALVLMARHMSKLLQGTNVTINAVDPGLVRGTQHLRRSPLNSTFLIKLFMQPWMWLLLKNPSQGAQTSVYAAVSSTLSKTSGIYFRDCEIASPSKTAENDELAEKLYDKSMALIETYL